MINLIKIAINFYIMKNKMKQQHHFSTTWKHVILKKGTVSFKNISFSYECKGLEMKISVQRQVSMKALLRVRNIFIHCLSPIRPRNLIKKRPLKLTKNYLNVVITWPKRTKRAQKYGYKSSTTLAFVRHAKYYLSQFQACAESKFQDRFWV